MQTPSDGEMLMPTVADPGFLEGGFCYTVARVARAKFLKPRPFFE